MNIWWHLKMLVMQPIDKINPSQIFDFRGWVLLAWPDQEWYRDFDGEDRGPASGGRYVSQSGRVWLQRSFWCRTAAEPSWAGQHGWTIWRRSCQKSTQSREGEWTSFHSSWSAEDQGLHVQCSLSVSIAPTKFKRRHGHRVPAQRIELQTGCAYTDLVPATWFHLM